MDCKSARDLLSFARPGGYDLDAADRAALEGHLAVCSDCDCLARAERRLDEHLGRAIQDVPIPAGLQGRLLDRLKRQRDDWWKQQLNRGMCWLAAAAAIALLVWGGLWWKESHKERLDSQALIEDGKAHIYSPATAGDAQGWFAARGHREVRVPPEFNYRFLVRPSIADLNGRAVPHLLFVRPASQNVSQIAEVFILTEKRFNISSVTDQSTHDPGYPVQVKVKRESDQVYLIVHTGDLDNLLDHSE